MNRYVRDHSARIARTIWTVLAIAGTISIVVRVATHWTTNNSICRVVANCSNSQLDQSAARSLSRYGVSVHAFAVFHLVAFPLVLATFVGLGALIIWRKPADRGAILAAFFLAAFPFVITTLGSIWTLATLTLFGLLFPDGRFAPRWTRWLALAEVTASIISVFSIWPVLLAIVGLMLPIPVLQVYRFRSVSSWAQRQQTKWALFGLGAAIFGLVAIILTEIFAPWPTANGSIYHVLTNTIGLPLLLFAIPISLAVSVLHSRLWDIDRVISRALVYTSLTAALAGIYIGGVIGLQALFHLVIGNSSAPSIAISTLAIVALFGPLRRRIQVVIDRRFYRSRYDAARILSAFGERLRDQVDLAHLSHDLTAVVHDSLHPEHVSLWLRDAGKAAPVAAGGEWLR